MTPLRPNRSLWGRAGRRWGAVDGVVVVPTGPLPLLGLDAVVMRQSPPVAFVVASGASGDDVETCNLPMNLQFVDGGSDGSSLGAELLHTVPRLSGEVEVFPRSMPTCAII